MEMSERRNFAKRFFTSKPETGWDFVAIWASIVGTAVVVQLVYLFISDEPGALAAEFIPMIAAASVVLAIVLAVIFLRRRSKSRR